MKKARQLPWLARQWATVEKRGNPGSWLPQRIIASASVLSRPIRSFDGNHEQDVEPEPVDTTTSSPPAGTIISAPEASPAVASPDIVVVLRS